MSSASILIHLDKNFKSFNVLFTSRRSNYLGESGGGGGNSTLGGPCGLTPVFGTGDFSNSSTPPHSTNLERRRGIEPRSPSLQLGRSPLAVAALGAPGVIRTPNGGFGIRSPHHRQPGCMVRPARLTDPPNQHSTALAAVASIGWTTGRMVGSVGFEPTLDTV